MTEVIGTVEAVGSKTLPSGTYYSFNVDDTWYRTGRTKTEVEKGYQVKFNFNKTQYGNEVDVDSLKFKKGEAPPPNKQNPGLSKDQYWANKEARDVETQQRISFQAAANTALGLVTAAVANGVIGFPKSAKPESKFETFKQMVLEETRNMFRLYQEVPDRAEEYLSDPEVEVKTQEEDFYEDQNKPEEDEIW